MISTSEFRKGAKIEYKGAPHEIVDYQHHKMGRGGAIIRTKLKNLITGSIFDDSFNPENQAHTASTPSNLSPQNPALV